MQRGTARAAGAAWHALVALALKLFSLRADSVSILTSCSRVAFANSPAPGLGGSAPPPAPPAPGAGLAAYAGGGCAAETRVSGGTAAGQGRPVAGARANTHLHRRRSSSCAQLLPLRRATARERLTARRSAWEVASRWSLSRGSQRCAFRRHARQVHATCACATCCGAVMLHRCTVDAVVAAAFRCRACCRSVGVCCARLRCVTRRRVHGRSRRVCCHPVRVRRACARPGCPCSGGMDCAAPARARRRARGRHGDRRAWCGARTLGETRRYRPGAS